MVQFFRSWRLLLLAIALACAAPAFAADKKPSRLKEYITEQITISGAVENKLSLNVDDLRKFPLHRVGEANLICQSGAEMEKLKNIVGVRLTDILEKAKIITREHNDPKKMIVIASASDGYKVVFSWTELFNSSLGEGVIVFFERDGAPLNDVEGRLAMVSVHDTRTGPRHVRWLKDIEVIKVAQ